MSRISIELVPSNEEKLRRDLTKLKAHSPIQPDLINIPHLLRFKMPAWEGAAIAQEFYPVAMPHIRAMDINLDEPLPMAGYFREHHITEALIIEGDPPDDMSHTVYPTITTDVLRKFRDELPEVKVFAGIDQHRGGMQDEWYRIRRKIQAGAAGFFTQPFYDLRFLKMYADMLDGLDVYWGLSPVATRTSQSYWERKNKVVFPRGFEPTMAWSIDFSRRVMDFVRQNGDSVYIMPIVGDLYAFLDGVFTA